MSATTASRPTSLRWKSVALPPEHGGWGFLIEPLLLGLLVAPSWAGVSLALGVTGASLLRQPLKIVWQDRRRGHRYARTALAERFALLYGALMVVGFLGAVVQAGVHVVLPFLFAVPLAGVAFFSYAQNRGRDLWPEMAGASVLALSAFGMGLAGGKPLGMAAALWLIPLARNFASILYIRARIRLDKGQPFTRTPTVLAHVLGLGMVGALAALGYAPVLAVVVMGILLVRAVHGLSARRHRVRVQTIGFLEVFYGLLTVAFTAAGYALGW